MKLGAQVDDEPVALAYELLGREAIPAVSRALKDTAAGVRTEAISLVRQNLTLRAADVRDAIRVPRTVSKGADGIAAEIRFSGKPVPLIDFSARQTRAGVTVQVKRGSPRKLIPSAFIARMKSGHRGVFIREQAVATASRRGHKHQASAFSAVARGFAARVPRLPIDELFSTSVKGVLGSQLILRELLAYAKDRFTRELRHEIKFRTQRKNRRAAR